MFFCHAGYEVKAAFIDKAGEWVCQAPLKQICSSPVLTAENRPPWFYNHQMFDLTMIVAPSAISQQQLCAGHSSDPVIEHIISKGGLINILQLRSNFADEGSYDACRIFFRELAPMPLHLSRSFSDAFARATALLAGRKQLADRHFSINLATGQPDHAPVEWPIWLCRLKDSLLQSGLTFSNEKAKPALFINICENTQQNKHCDINLITSGSTDRRTLSATFIDPDLEISQKTASDNILLIQRLPKGLRVCSPGGIRLLPELTNHCSFSRLAAMLVNLLQKKDTDLATGHNNDLC